MCIHVCIFLKEPRTVVLGSVRKAKGMGAKRRVVEIDETMIYIPILETLRILLENEAVMAEVSIYRLLSQNI